MRVVLLQFAASAAVLGLLWADAGPRRVGAVLEHVDPRWVAAGMGLQVLSLLVHEARVWLAMDRTVPAWRVVRVGLAANLVNLVLPARVADVVAGMWIARDTGVPLGRGLGAYGVVSLLEMVAFGLVLMGILVGAATEFDAIVQTGMRREALGWVSAMTLGSVGVIVVATRLLGRRAEARPNAAGPLDVVRDALLHAARSVGGTAGLALHLAVAAAQVGFILVVFRCNLAALGTDVVAPWLAIGLVLAIGALGGLVLPAGFGAGPAAAATLVLPALGGTPAEAIAFGGLIWLTAAVPDVVLGLPLLWGRLAALRRGGATATPPPTGSGSAPIQP